MRFAARFLKYRHGVRAGRHMVLQDGQRQVLTSDLIAVFRPGPEILTEEERQYARDHMNHRGLPIDLNTNRPVDPIHRISGYDTVEAQQANGWTDEEREIVEQTLLTSPRIGNAFILLPVAKVEKPWATYDETDGGKVVEIALMLGLDLPTVLAFERENRNDSGVVMLLERAILESENDSPDSEVASEPVGDDEPVVIEA